jgi:hypothetical protein
MLDERMLTDGLITGHLAELVAGHRELLADVAEAAGHDQLRRHIEREGRARAAVPGSQVGAGTGGTPGAPAVG